MTTPARVIDLSFLTATDGFTIQGDTVSDNAGHSVSGAGDVNGDGIADLIVGAWLGNDGGLDAGEAYVIYGQTGSTRSTIDLTNLSASDGFIIQGDVAGDRAGYSVSGAGDVNGDGIADLMVGAPNGGDGGIAAGEAYVIYGQTGATRTTLDLTGLTASDGFVIQGDNSADFAGNSVSGAGDVNGDGIEDVIVGARGGDDGGSNSGEAYVIYGQAGATRGLQDLTGLAASDGFIIQGDAPFDYSGFSVSGAGDVNGDGIADLIVGAPGGSDGGIAAGEAYVIYGQTGATRTIVDLTGLAASDGFVIQGDVTADYAGRSVSGAGDVNGDGIEDIIVGANFGDDGGTFAGEAYVIYGQTGATRTMVDLSGLAASDGFIIQGDVGGDQAGFSVSGAGDVNGDGIADVIVGAIQGDDGGTNAGEAFVIFGQAGVTRATVDLTGLTSDDGFIIQGDTNYDLAGHSVSGAGDVNGDGIDDLIVGANLGDDGGPSAGEGYVIYGGSASGFGAVVDLSTLGAQYGFVIQGDTIGDRAGFRVALAGDVNGDGIGDMIVAAIGGSGSATNAGEAYVIYGQTGATRTTLDLSNLTTSEGYLIRGDAENDQAGSSVAGVGDINGDGINDLIVGAATGDDGGSNAGEAYVIYGLAGTTRNTLDLDDLDPEDGFIIQGDVAGDLAGVATSGFGDVNGDGIDDMMDSASFGSDGGLSAGEVYVIYGTTNLTRGTLDLTNLTASEGFIIQGDMADDMAGVDVSVAGDVNGDGIEDMIVGAFEGDDGGTDAGEAYVIYGQAGATRTVVDLTGLAASDGFVIQGDAAGDNAGRSVSGAGDINGDGIDDVIVGASEGDDGGSGSGEAYVIYGVAGATRGMLDLSTLTTSEGFIIQGDDNSDRVGESVSAAGDVNGDGIDDVIVGATNADNAKGDTGEAYVIFGQAGVSRGTVDLTGLAGSDGFTIQGDMEDDLAGSGVSGGRDVNGDGIDDVIVGAMLGDDGGSFAGEAYVIYGRRPTDAVTRTGTDINQTILGGHLNDTLDGGGGNDNLDGGLGADDLDGGSGKDTVLYRYATAGVTLNLNAGTGTAGEADGDTFTSIERVEGSAFGDDITGDTSANVLRGGEGNDTLDGGGGNDRIRGGEGADDLDGRSGRDWLDYRDSSAGVTVDIGANTASGGDAQGDVITGFEFLQGSDFADDLTGGGSGSIIRGGLGADTLDGGTSAKDALDYRGSDTGVTVDLGLNTASGGHAQGDVISNFERFFGSDFNDDVTGTAQANNIFTYLGSDTVDGGDGNDRIRGGAGGDDLDGGDGVDWLDYRGSDGAVDVNLGTNVVSGGDAAGDTVTGFERVYGGDFDDVITGSAGRNFIRGGDGNDTLDGGGQKDKLFGEGGDDTFVFSAGDTFDGGADSDEVILVGDQAEFTRVTDGAITTVTEIATGDFVLLISVESQVYDDGTLLT